MAVARTLCSRFNNISVVDLLETLAVVRQTNLVNTLDLMSAKQERDEPFPQLVACLCGLALVCDHTVVCTCQLNMSKVGKLVLMMLIGVLNDEDTKQTVLCKAEEMMLNATISFVKARETGKCSLKVWGRGLSKGHGAGCKKGSKNDLGPFKY